MYFVHVTSEIVLIQNCFGQKSFVQINGKLFWSQIVCTKMFLQLQRRKSKVKPKSVTFLC
jgi:hypothetical protein